MPSYRAGAVRPDPLTAWHQYITSLTWQKGSLDDAGNRAFLRAATLGIPEQVAFDEVSKRIATAGERTRVPKLQGQLVSAYRRAGAQKGSGNGQFSSSYSPSPKWPKPDLEAIRQIVREGFSLYDLSEASPRRFNNAQSYVEEIIDTLFPANPLLCVGRTKFVFQTKRREEFRGSLSDCAYIVPNPMLKVEGTTRAGKISQHSLEATAAKTYQVIEFDFRSGHPLVAEWARDGISVADACAALHWHLSCRLPFVAATHSAGISVHGWYNVFGKSELSVRAFMAEAIRLGADPATWCRSQFVRLPDGLRENGARQTAFYLDPKNALKV
jgi:hypothetical protein